MSDSAQQFETAARHRLRALEQELDADSLARLSAARSRALAARGTQFPLPGPAWLTGAAMAMVLGVATLLGYQHWQTEPDAAASGQLAENPELYRDLDFYMWLSESELGNRG